MGPTRYLTRKISKWFQILESLVLIDPFGMDRKIHPHLIKPAFNFKGHTYQWIKEDTNTDFTWIALYSLILQQLIIGKLLMNNSRNDTILVEHYELDNVLNTTTNSIIKPCSNTCSPLNYHLASYYNCVNEYPLKDAIIIPHVNKLTDTQFSFETMIEDLYS